MPSDLSIESLYFQTELDQQNLAPYLGAFPKWGEPQKHFNIIRNGQSKTQTV